MKKNLMVLFSAMLLIFTAMPALPAAAEVPAAQEVASYELPFTVLQADSDEVSTAGKFVKSPAEVKVEGGKTIVYMTLLDSQYWQSLKIQDGKDFVVAEVVSENEEEKTRLVKFELKDVEKILNAKAHIIVTGIPGLGEYDKTHDIRFQFDGSNVPAEEETEVDEETPVTPEAPVAIEDGEYTIGLNVLHEEEEKPSSMSRFIEAPAALSVKDGKQVVTLTLTNNEQITEFQVEQDGEFVDATVVNVDEEANKRTVSFEVADLSEIKNVKVTVFVAQANHTGNYTVRLAFDQDSVEPVATETPETPEAPEAPESPETPEQPEEEATVSFKDIDNTWAKSYIEALAAQEIVKGKTPETFAPQDTITRKQFALIIARALDLEKQEFQGTFSDLTKEMEDFVYEVEAANRAGIITGDNGKFNPNAAITRQQMAAMIIRAIEYKDTSLLEDVATDVEFEDAGQVSDYAKDAVQLAAGLGIIDGDVVKGQKVFAPKAKATRAHAVKMVYNMLETIQ
ncbi:NEAT domain-containing protein [Sporosarcina sp. ACRSL]|uniref:NEAT domain-containing protein n=1 Tax=Sporosarcina sp. ACRSL TaxID=2918215 RepID=UPI001EF5F487|nr:NEAT domain-containing protein [Sporosarcina sp. ACRSL]MCG7346453.1 NEAT domain-containing protein [Sporosarcina sp. ACRSL]